MIREEYERAKKELKIGSDLSLIVRGNYGDYQVEGVLSKFEDGYVHLLHGKAHHYKRIRSMTAFSEKRVVSEAQK